MKKMTKAVRLYLKAAINPFTLGFALFMTIGMTIGFVIEPEYRGSEEYLSMIYSIGIAHIGIYMMLLFGGYKNSQNKVYHSAGCAKELFTVAPNITALMFCLVYDAGIALIAVIGSGTGTLSDVVFSNSVYGVTMLLCSSAAGKKKYEWLLSAVFIIVMTSSMWLVHIDALQNGFGMPLWLSLTAAAGIYALGTLLSVMLAEQWWKKGDRFTMPNPVLVNL